MNCSACGRNITAKSGGNIIGLSILVSNESTPSFVAEFKEIYPELELPLIVDVCYACWIKSLGIKAKI